MAGLDEFALIARLFAPLAASAPESLGLSDDVALIAADDGAAWAVTTDAIVAGVHFLPDDPPELIARKLIRVNLSDLAAKGAEPRFLLLDACFPGDVGEAWLDRFASGLKSDCDHFKVALIGGDTVATPGPLTLAMTALGRVVPGRVPLRSQAVPEDDIWVSGWLGDAALGLLVAKGGAVGLSDAHAAYLLDRYRLPQPRLALGRAMAGLVHAAMDISDGLIGDLGHICDASTVGADIWAPSLPLSPAAAAVAFADPRLAAAGGGDDYELLFTAPPAAAALIAGLDAGVPVSRVGRITARPGVRLLDGDGGEIALASAGYRHFHGMPG